MELATTRVFQSGNSQAIRIPAEMRTGIKDYYIRKVGDMFIIYPVEDPWAPARQVVGTFPDMADRNQPTEIPPREEL